MVRSAARAGHEDKAKELANAIPDVPLRGRAQLEVLRARMQKGGKVDESAADSVDKDSPAQGVAREWIARHNARLGAAGVKSVNAWQAEAHKPFGFIGVALGLQDKGQ